MTDSEVKAAHSQKKKSRKRVKEDLDCSTREKHVNNAGEMREMDAEIDMSGPTMAEKLASLELFSDAEAKNAAEKEAPLSANIRSVDSVHVLLKQAIHAQDHALLVDCLSTTDEKLIESRTSTYQSALQLSACLDCLFAEIPEADENASPVLIYEDKDSDEEDESDNTTEIDEESLGL